VAINKLVVIGFGLIGASVAAGLRRAGYCQKVIAVARSEETCSLALSLDLADEACHSIDDITGSLGEGDVVCIAVPTLSMEKILEGLKTCIANGVTVTDCASVCWLHHGLWTAELPARSARTRSTPYCCVIAASCARAHAFRSATPIACARDVTSTARSFPQARLIRTSSSARSHTCAIIGSALDPQGATNLNFESYTPFSRDLCVRESVTYALASPLSL